MRAVGKFAERMPYNVLGYREEDSGKREEIWQSIKKVQKIRGIDTNHPLVQKVWQSVKNS